MSHSTGELVAFRINKAKGTFQDAQLLLEAMRWDSAANRLYYASFYMISAYMAKQEIRVTTHSGVKTIDNAQGKAFNSTQMCDF